VTGHALVVEPWIPFSPGGRDRTERSDRRDRRDRGHRRMRDGIDRLGDRDARGQRNQRAPNRCDEWWTGELDVRRARIRIDRTLADGNRL